MKRYPYYYYDRINYNKRFGSWAQIKEFSPKYKILNASKKIDWFTNPKKVEFSITDFEVSLSQILSKIKSKFVYI